MDEVDDLLRAWELEELIPTFHSKYLLVSCKLTTYVPSVPTAPVSASGYRFWRA